CVNLGLSLPLVQGGQRHVRAVGTDKRRTALPDVPTIAETLPGFASSAWFAVVAPPKTPAALAGKINADIAEAIREPEVRKRLADLSPAPVGGTLAETAAFLPAGGERWKHVIRAAHAHAQQGRHEAG